MSAITGVVRNRPWVLGRLGLLLLLPWIWAAFVVPLWVIAVCGGLWVLAFLLGFRYFVTPMFTRRRANDDLAVPVDEIIKMRTAASPKPGLDINSIQGELGGFHKSLGKWQGTSEYSSGRTALVKEGVGEVISQTEQAVLALTLSFRGITNKTRQQMDTAMSLLRRNANQLNVSEGGWLSLPDYIHAYETQLQEVIEGMIRFSAASDQMLKHQTKVREQSILIDELLDELRSMAIRIGRLALDSSVAAGESGRNREMLVKLTDSIRESSDQTHGLTRTVRASLETIRNELVSTYKLINSASTIAKESAERAKADVAQLNVTMIEKTKEVEASLAKVNSLGQEIQQDVNNAIVAMQFQDITQQKLEHMREDALSEVMRNLNLLSKETQEMLKRDVFRAIRTETQRRNASLGDNERADSGAEPPTGRDSGQPPLAASDVNGTAVSAPAIKKVDLF